VHPALDLVTLPISVAVEGDYRVLLQVRLRLVQIVVGDDEGLVVCPVPHADQDDVWESVLVRRSHGDDALLLEDRLDLG